jgi:protein SCO1
MMSPCGGRRLRLFRPTILLLLLLPTLAAAPVRAEALPDLGAAAPFRLTTQDGALLALTELRGKVVLLAFIYASCKDVCLTETARMVRVQDGLGEDFGRRVHFLSVTLDPEADNGEVLRQHARRFGARLEGWAFLTGTPAQVRQVASDYGVVFRKTAPGEVEHNTLASLIDGAGHLRVQYLGTDFDPDEMVADLRGLVREGAAR